MSSSMHLNNVAKARVDLLKSMRHTVEKSKLKEFEDILLNVENSLSRCINSQIDVEYKGNECGIIFYETKQKTNHQY